MRVRTVALSLIAALTVGIDSAGAAGIRPVVVSETNGEIVVELLDERTPAEAFKADVDVAIPVAGTHTVTVDPGLVAGGGAPAFSHFVFQPFGYRGANVVHVVVQIPSVFGAVKFAVNPTITVQYTPAAVTNNRNAADPLLRNLVANRDVFPVVARNNTPNPWLSRSGRWVRLTVSDRGMYAVTGADLQGLGVSLASINDPATFRLFTAHALDQLRSLGDPRGTWQHDVVMDETRILVEDGNDGTFDASDRIIFYGLGSDDWANYYDPAAPDSTYHEHTRATANQYFLTWDGSLATPVQMATRDASPRGGGDVTSYLHREYFERDVIAELHYRGDGWLWLEATSNRRLDLASVNVVDLVASAPQVFRTVLLSQAFGGGHRVRYATLQGAERQIAQFDWDTFQTRFESGIPVRHAGSFLFSGLNQITFQMTKELNPADRSFVAWYSIWYQRQLRAHNDRIAFTSADTTGVVDFAVSGFGLSGTLYAFDVTDPLAPVQLTGLATTTQGTARELRMSAGLNAETRHFEATEGTRFLRPISSLMTSPDLRADATGPNMVIITHESLRAGADMLATHRRSHLPGFTNPVVKVVTTREIYDNFSGGLPDPFAIRNYVKFLYDNYNTATNNPALTYVLLFGDATFDFHNNISTQIDHVPTHIHFFTAETYNTDAWYGHLDVGDQVPGQGIRDVALGRLPAANRTEAIALATKVINYEVNAPRTPWRKVMVLVADDEISHFGCNETVHTNQSEGLYERHVADFFDVRKVYLTEYTAVSGVKPAARFDLIGMWNEGALVVNYIGHGSAQQMADEQVFLGTDVASLNNGDKLPILTALSCTIGDFANPTAKSLSEKLLLREEGGVIATMTASQESFIGENGALNIAVFDRLVPRFLGGFPVSFGQFAMESKITSLLRNSLNPTQEDNNWKYNLLADPACLVAAPREAMRMEEMQADTLVAGLRKSIRGQVWRNGALDASFNGTVRVEVREPVVNRVFVTPCTINNPFPTEIKYRLAGGRMFDGTTDVVGGRFSVSFRVPRFAATGTHALVTAYAENGNTDAAVTLDSSLVLIAPTIADSLGLKALDGAPRVDLRFKSGLETVKPGETVLAVVRDADGINTLATTNEGVQAIIIDDLPVPIDVGEFFSLDHGGSDTSGVLLYPLPDLDFGPHRLIYKVADSFGQTNIDTLSFQVTDPADFYAEALFNYPNPFPTSTQFLFRVSDRATIRLDIFTSSGKRVRRIETTRDGGEQWIDWDGRDVVGDEIANGTYLYVARVSFEGLDRPPVVLRGTLSKIR